MSVLAADVCWLGVTFCPGVCAKKFLSHDFWLCMTVCTISDLLVSLTLVQSQLLESVIKKYEF